VKNLAKKLPKKNEEPKQIRKDGEGRTVKGRGHILWSGAPRIPPRSSYDSHDRDRSRDYDDRRRRDYDRRDDRRRRDYDSRYDSRDRYDRGDYYRSDRHRYSGYDRRRVSEPIYDRNGNISNPDTDERKKNSSKSDGSKESDPPVTVTVNSQILGSNYGRRSQSPKKKEHEHKDDKKKKR